MAEFWRGGDVKPTQLLAEMIRLGEEFPDKHAACRYTDYEDDGETPTQPVCLVGTAIYNLTGKFVHSEFEGTRIGAMMWAEALGADNAVSWNREFTNPDEFTAYKRAVSMQTNQDLGWSWGFATNR